MLSTHTFIIQYTKRIIFLSKSFCANISPSSPFHITTSQATDFSIYIAHMHNNNNKSIVYMLDICNLYNGYILSNISA